jgi:hypothetical protein
MRVAIRLLTYIEPSRTIRLALARELHLRPALQGAHDREVYTNRQ